MSATTTATQLAPSKPFAAKAKEHSIPIPPSMRFTPLPNGFDISNYSNPAVLTADGPNLPCRRCLRDPALGEEVFLVSYDPFPRSTKDASGNFVGVFAHAGPIYVHKAECDLADAPRELPTQLQRRLLSLRAYDVGNNMAGCDACDGVELIERCAKLFENERIEYINVHFAQPGCFAVKVERAFSGL